MKLNLGSADRRIPGFLSVDIEPPADVVTDLTGAWPWPDSSVDEIVANDIFEHLPSKRHSMNELWRVLLPGGKAVIVVPSASKGDGGFCDPTHVSYWTASDFEYYEIGNFARERFRGSAYYGVKADFRVISVIEDRYQTKWRGEVYKITATLEAAK
jgi:predicted SAM-dependent methyltransferase